MDVSAIIPTLPKNEKYAQKCYDSLVDNSPFSMDVFVMQNGEGTDQPQGQCKAVNRGAKDATGNYILVTNDDMYFAPGWFKMPADQEEWPLAFSPNLVEPVQIGSAPPFLKFDGGTDLESFKEKEVNEFVANHHEENEWEDGFNLPFFIRRDVWETIGGYDEAYDPWGSNSDSDLQSKLELAGIKPRRNRNCLVYHFGSKSETFTPEKQEYWQANWDYYIRKWGFLRAESPMIWYSDNIIDYDELIFHPDWEGYYGK